MPPSVNETLIILAGALAGAVAAITGFGIGSLLTPLLASQMDTRLAVAAVSVPHVAGTLLRWWMLRPHVERRVFWTFGLTSAAGGLAGALLHGASPSRALTLLFGGLLALSDRRYRLRSSQRQREAVATSPA